MTNFAFIPPRWKDFQPTLLQAERYVYEAPDYCAMLCRKSLEQWVRWVYEHDPDLEMPYDESLNNLLYQDAFKRMLPSGFMEALNAIRKSGNNAVHTNKHIAGDDTLHLLRLLRLFVAYVVQLYSKETVKIPEFDSSLVSRVARNDKSKTELADLEQKYQNSLQQLQKAEAELAELKVVKDQKIAYLPPLQDPDESHTRKLYIDALLAEAGWDPDGASVREYPLENCFPKADGSLGRGFADYVLWGADGLPLAVIEAKRSARDPRVGGQQAKLYADALQRKFGQRPVIFYSNGYTVWLWDDMQYPEREVQGFYTREELQTLVQRRSLRQQVGTAAVNMEIAGRAYQIEALRAMGDAFDRGHRGALLVMATGTGKTRTAAAAVELLSKAGWVKRVLFLADRNALVTQAKESFNEQLPNYPAVDLTKEKKNDTARVVFSTYQTMIRLIDGERDGDNRYFGVGHFDLIIFDEIHRSVYNKYQAIFNYFDGLRLGLTATPKSDGDKDTYALFHLQPGAPTFAYELGEAVNEQHLVPYRALSVPLKFQREGIKYKDLSAEDQRRYEEQFADPITGELPDEIDAGALNSWLFNKDTVIKVLAFLMERGLKVEGGDKLAKTIIFTKSHKHSLFVKQVFDEQYPEYKGAFLQLIDYQTEHHDTILRDFKEPQKMPQIAVSVDMLDTGIDVPEIGNLVFFKIVRSFTKFWQMIGRGTRLRNDLFGPGRDKTEFYIFDFCQNFEFFDEHPKGFEAPTPKSISRRLFELRLDVAYLIAQDSTEENREYGEELVAFLLRQVQSLHTGNFIVRQELTMVERYRDPAAWSLLTVDDVGNLKRHIGHLVTEVTEDERSKRFDVLMLDLQLSMLTGTPKQERLRGRVQQVARGLATKTTIPLVQEKIGLIKAVQRDDYWQDISVEAVDIVREELRDLLFVLDKEQTLSVFTDLTDDLDVHGVREMGADYMVNDLRAYRSKVEAYIRENSDYLVIHKLKHNIPLSSGDLNLLERMLFDQGHLGTKADLVTAYGEQPLGLFVRSIVGLDEQAVRDAFRDFIADSSLNAQQIRFVDQLVKFLTSKGTFSTEAFFEPPFTDIHSGGITEVFDMDKTGKIISLLDRLNANSDEVG